MNDNELTLLRRRHIGFVFQFYNLLPMLTAEENVELPLSVAGTEVDEAWFSDVDGAKWACPTGEAIVRLSCQVASSSELRSRGRSSHGRP